MYKAIFFLFLHTESLSCWLIFAFLCFVTVQFGFRNQPSPDFPIAVKLLFFFYQLYSQTASKVIIIYQKLISVISPFVQYIKVTILRLMMHLSVLPINTLKFLLLNKGGTLLPILRYQNKIEVKHFLNIKLKQTRQIIIYLYF